ncbi:Uncharacterized protein PAM68-like [Linum perenne]
MNALFSSHNLLLQNIPRIQSPHLPKWKLNANGSKGFGTSKSQQPKKISNNELIGGRVDKDDVIPEQVFERMTARIFVAVGAPMGLGLGLLSLIGYVKERSIVDVPMWVPFLTTLFTFTVSIMGIAYGGLSTSLDKDRKGSLLGIEEAKVNWGEMWKEEEEGGKE